MSRRIAALIVRACAIAAALCGLSLGLAPAALAEESRSDARATIEEIIVTARKREESVQDVPIAMTALTQEIRESSVRDITDLNAYLPNVIIENNMARSRGSAINIRGLSYTETDKSFDPPIAVVLDGVYIGTSSGQVIENFDIERIEVLRGPQGTLFGKNTVGGVISAVRSRPTGELGGQIQLTGGKWGQREVRAIANLPEIGDMLSTKLFYTLIKSDGYMDNVFLDKEGPKKDYQNYGAALLFQPVERFEALLTVETYADDSHVGASRNANDPGFILCSVYGSCRDPDTPKNEYSTDQQNVAKFDTDAVSLTMTFDINDNLQLVSVTGWRDEKEDTISEFDGSSLPYIWIDNDNTHEQKSTELRLEGTYEKFNFVLGGYLWDNHYDQNWVTYGFFWDSVVPGLSTNADTGIPFAVFGLPIPGNAGLTDLCLLELVGALRCDQSVGFASAGLGPNFTQLLFQEQDVNSQAVFFQADYHLTDKWTVTAGIRWTREEKEFRGAQSYLAPVSRAGLPAEVWAVNLAGDLDIFDDGTTWKEWTPKLG
ncbi:MAG TPA: TonB-dependent receptor, partial [Pseudomonadales bacterium]